MESIRSAITRVRKYSENQEKIKDRWGEEQEPVREGVRFYLEYAGSTLVDELEEGESYGDKICAKSVKTILTMAKSLKNHPRVGVSVSSTDIVVTELEQNTVLTSLNIHRIHFCSADHAHERVFAYIARCTENETMECHAFLCPKRKIAEAVALSVAQAFQIAKQDAERDAQQRRESEERSIWSEHKKRLASSNQSGKIASQNNNSESTRTQNRDCPDLIQL